MFRKLLMLSSLSLVLFIFSGCMATKPYQQIRATSDRAVVYVYRPESLIYRGTPYHVYINGKNMGMIINNAYLPFQLNPGRVSISLRDNRLMKALVDKKVYFFESGKRYYIRVNSGLYGAFTIEQVPAEVGAKEIKETLYYEDSQK